MGRWERREDAKNLTLIMASGAVGALITGGVLIAQSLSAHRAPPRVWRVEARPRSSGSGSTTSRPRHP